MAEGLFEGHKRLIVHGATAIVTIVIIVVIVAVIVIVPVIGPAITITTLRLWWRLRLPSSIGQFLIYIDPVKAVDHHIYYIPRFHLHSTRKLYGPFTVAFGKYSNGMKTG